MIKVSGMTVTGLRTTMTSPTVPPSSHQQQQQHQQQKSMSRLSNFSVASLLADTRPKSPSEPLDMIMPVATTTTPGSSPPRADHHHHLLFHPAVHSLHNKSLPLPSPPSQPELHHNNNNDVSAITTKNERHTPHSSGAESDIEYDESNLEDDDEDIDIEEMNNDDSCSTPDLDSSKSPMGGSGLSSSSPHMLSSPSSAAAAAAIAAGHVPIRPTPFSALAAAAAAWGGMGGSMQWSAAAAAAAGRQMQPFGPPGLFPGQGFGPGGGEFVDFLFVCIFEKILGRLLFRVTHILFVASFWIVLIDVYVMKLLSLYNHSIRTESSLKVLPSRRVLNFSN